MARGLMQLYRLHRLKAGPVDSHTKTLKPVAILRGAWVAHGPPRFLLGPPVFFFISRLCSFD